MLVRYSIGYLLKVILDTITMRAVVNNAWKQSNSREAVTFECTADLEDTVWDPG